MNLTRWWISSLAATGIVLGAGGSDATCPYETWRNGPSCKPGYFPVGVWLQDPTDSRAWADAGINLYVGLWDGPTAAQLETLRLAGMQVLAEQNATALAYTEPLSDGRPVIVGWTLPDEPDNKPRTAPSEVRALFDRFKRADPTRPIFLNLSQGLAWDDGTWIGQGGRIRPERDYPAYLAASDIAAFDIYPMASPRAEVSGAAWRVALGVDRLQQYSPPGRIIWNSIETGNVLESSCDWFWPFSLLCRALPGLRDEPAARDRRAGPKAIRAEVWMSILHGSRGIIYFVHGKSRSSRFDPRALLRPENAEYLSTVSRINAELNSLGAIIQLPPAPGQVSIEDILGSGPVDYAVRASSEGLHIVAVGMRAAPTRKRFRTAFIQEGSVAVIGENRVLPIKDGAFSDDFDGYEAHLYRIESRVASPSQGRVAHGRDPCAHSLGSQATCQSNDWRAAGSGPGGLWGSILAK